MPDQRVGVLVWVGPGPVSLLLSAATLLICLLGILIVRVKLGKWPMRWR